MSEFLLDTDTISYFFRGTPSVKAQVEKYLTTGGVIHLSAITYYEVCNGLYYKDAKRQLERFKAFTAFCVVLPLSESVADLAAQIFGDLRSKGITVGHTDVLVAATAIYYQMQLITNNTKHFKDIPQLRLQNWLVE